MSFDHAGRTAFVTGAGSGIGQAIALRLVDEGAAVAVADVRLDAAELTVAEIEARGGRALAVRLDVRNPAQADRARAQALEAFGSIHHLVNNAGLVRMSALDDLEEDEWDLVLDTNLKGMYVVSRAIAPAIGDAGGGAIVNMSTIESEVVVSSAGHPQVHYNASKGGVKMLTKALAVELAHRRIRVNAVAPGPIATGFRPDSNRRGSQPPCTTRCRCISSRRTPRPTRASHILSRSGSPTRC